MNQIENKNIIKTEDILVVEDDEMNRMCIAHQLKKYFDNIKFAETFEQALECIYNKELPRLVFLDVDLNDNASGINLIPKFLELSKEIRKNVSIVMISTHNEKNMEGQSQGAHAGLKKEDLTRGKHEKIMEILSKVGYISQ